MIVTTILFLLCLMAVSARAGMLNGAKEAGMQASNNHLGIIEELDHHALLAMRIAVCGTLTLVLWFTLECLHGWSWWCVLHLLCMAVTSWACFTICHRLSINRGAGKDWRYVAPGNGYDARAIRWTYGQDVSVAKHRMCYAFIARYTNAVHQAGLLLYGFEFLTLAAAVAGIIQNTLHHG